MFLLIAPKPLWAGVSNIKRNKPLKKVSLYIKYSLPLTDTIIGKKNPDEDEKKIKELQKAKRQSKPEKIDDAVKPNNRQRERRPEGMERPPEIPRRNNN